MELQVDEFPRLKSLSAPELEINRLGELLHGVRKLTLAVCNLSSKLVGREVRSAAVGTVLVALEPGDGPLDLLATCRASDGQLFFVEGEGGHK